MKYLKQYIAESKALHQNVNVDEKLVVNKNYKSTDENSLRNYLADNVDFNYAYVMKETKYAELGKRIFDKFRRFWVQTRNKNGLNEWQYIKDNVSTDVRELTKEFNKYKTVYQFKTIDSEPDKKAGLYYLFDNLEKEGYEIIDLIPDRKTDICIRYIKFDNTTIFQYGRYGKYDIYESYSTYIGY